MRGEVPTVFQVSSRMVGQFLPQSGLSQLPWGGLNLSLLDWIFVSQLLKFSIMDLGVLWEGRLWGWARIVPHELAWTTMNLPRNSSKNDLAVSLHVLG